MKPTTQIITMVAALLFSLAVAAPLQAQTASTANPTVNNNVAAAVQVIAAQTIKVPAGFMKRLEKSEQSRPVEVLDLAVRVRSKSVDAFPPSLQPRLYIGQNAYPIQRVEYSNWDAGKEKAINPDQPVGKTQVMHFFLENWRDIKTDQPMILSVLPPSEFNKRTNGQINEEQFKRLIPESTQMIPRYVPEKFLKLAVPDK